MKAAVCYEFGKPLVVEHVTLDPPQAGEVKVRIAATAVCHSDVHIINGDFKYTTPVIAGHESAGIVEEVGESVTLTKPGDHVVVSLLRSCGRCHSCVTGAPQLCEAEWPLDSNPRLHNQGGEPIRHGVSVAGFAEYVVVDQSQVVPISAEIELDKASLLACGVITGVGAVTNTAQVEPGSSVAVIGCGGVGLNAVQGAALAGAYPIIAVDLLDMKLEAAKTFGATHTIHAGQNDVRRAVRDLTRAGGVDYVFATVGSQAAMEQGLRLLRRRGTLVLVGLLGRESVAVGVMALAMGEQRVLGSNMGSSRLRVDVPRLVKLYQEGRLKLDELISARYPLDEINEAIAALERGEALRNVIVF